MEKEKKDAVNRNDFKFANGMNTCRACLIQNEELRSLFDPENSDIGKSLLDMLAICTSLNVSSNDQYPKHICNKCVDELYKAYTFREKCLNSIKELNLQFSSDIVNEYSSIGKINEPLVLLDVLKDCYIPIDRSSSENDLNVKAETCSADNVYIKRENESENENEKISNQSAIEVSQIEIKSSDDDKCENLTLSDDISNSKCKKKYLCNQCGVYVANFQSHVLKHSNFKPHQCAACGRQYKSKSALNIHKRTHTRETRYTCDLCNKKFITWHSKKCHIKTNHSTEKPYVCKICSKSFKQSSGLIIHVRTHTGENPYVCNICNKAFKTSTSLKRHVLVHTGEKNYFCDLCDKRFNRSFNLKQHMITHTGERRHKCKICGKAFTQAHVLRGHMKTHRSIEQLNFNKLLE